MRSTSRRPRAVTISQAVGKDKNFIGLTEKIFAVLEAFNANPREPVPLERMTSLVGLAKTSTHRLLYSMRKLGYIAQDVNGSYSLSEKFYALGGNALPYQHLTSIARPILNQLVMRYGESVHIGVLENNVVLIVAVAPSQNAFRCAGEVGECQYPHSTAMGKCILANLDQEKRDAVLNARGLPKMTPRTHIDRDILELELERVRAQGWAINDGENIEGVICIGAPIFGRGDNILAALSMSGPANPMTLVLDELRKGVRQAAGRISLILGARRVLPEELVSVG